MFEVGDNVIIKKTLRYGKIVGKSAHGLGTVYYVRLFDNDNSKSSREYVYIASQMTIDERRGGKS